MKTIIVTTPENIEIEYRLAALGSRIAAAMIDMIIVLAAGGVFLAFALGAFFDTAGPAYSGWVIGGIMIAFFAFLFSYFIVSELAMKGQSVGKKILKLRVIRQNGQPVTFFPSLIRNLFRYFIDMFGIGLLCIFFNQKHMRTGDMAAGTIVVAENPEQIALSALGAARPAEAAILADDKYRLTSEEYRLLSDYFDRKAEFIDGGARVRRKLAAYMAQKFNVPAARVDDDALTKILQINRQEHNR